MGMMRDIDMTSEIRLSLTAKLIPRLIQPLVRCKICKKKAASYFFATSSVGGGFVVLLFCEHCFETLNVLYKRVIRQRVEEGTYLRMKLRIKPKDVDDARVNSEQTIG